jgi:hypothetical protein
VRVCVYEKTAALCRAAVRSHRASGASGRNRTLAQVTLQ